MALRLRHDSRHAACLAGPSTASRTTGGLSYVMRRTAHSRALIALAIVVAFVAIVVPTCRMVGCSMTGGAMPWGHSMIPGFFGDCGGTYLTNGAPTAIVPSGVDSLVLALVFAVFAAAALYRPRTVVQRIVSHSADPPPPPEDPLGQRFRS